MTFYTFLRSRSSYELRFLLIELTLSAFLFLSAFAWTYNGKFYHTLTCLAGALLLASFAAREFNNLLKQYEEEKDLDVHER